LRMVAPSASHQAHPILYLQQLVGNQAILRLLRANADDREARFSTKKVARFARYFSQMPAHPKSLASIQTKLAVSSPGDIYEQEADRVAEQVMRMQEPGLRRACHCGGGCPSCQENAAVKHALKVRTPDIGVEHEAVGAADQVMNMSGEDETHAQLQIMTKGLSGQSCDSAPSGEREEDETNVMRKATLAEPHRGIGNVTDLLSRSRGGGCPMPGATRTFMETRFGHDFGDVRIHTDGDAAQMTKDLQAQAFTTGRDIYFQPSQYAPQTSSGRKLLAHELTHVIQQRGSEFVGRAIGNNGGDRKDWIQRFTLNGFPPTEEAAMKAAIPVAADMVSKCSKLSTFDRFLISKRIKYKTYDFVKNLGMCGWTFPSSPYIEIGKSAFNKRDCCDLSSTIAHEVSHTYWFTEGQAQKLECTCFGCSC
jgi:Domain of unknown function (DUF4157)